MPELLDAYGRAIPRSGPEKLTLRRWEAAKTTRLNKQHWAGANDQSVNLDISMWVSTLRKRAILEAANNSTLEGVIFTHEIDLVGARGPSLQVHSSNEEYNQAIEAVWNRWTKKPEITGRMSFGALLRQIPRMWWYCGEHLLVEVNDPRERGPIKMKLQAIHPRRLDTPATMSFLSPKRGMGIEVDAYGAPVKYFVNKEDPFGEAYLSTEFDEIDARYVRHVYFVHEPDQMRGVPLIASALEDIASLRDFDAEVLDAARAAAEFEVFLHAPLGPNEVPPVDLGDSAMELERRTIRALPPGYTAQQVKGEQPTNNYLDFRHEHHAGIGRPINMPLMRVRLDAHEYNYSSARFETNIYGRGLEVQREIIESMALTPTLESIMREAELARIVPPMPADVDFDWVWPVLPSIDPQKEAEGIRAEMENRTLPWSDACRRQGRDPDKVMESHQRDKKQFEEADVELPPSLSVAKTNTPPGAAPNQDQSQPAKKNKQAAPAARIEAIQ